jgi:hypothetical protein
MTAFAENLGLHSRDLVPKKMFLQKDVMEEMTSSEKAEYLFFVTKYMEKKMEIASFELQKQFVDNFNSISGEGFGTETFESKLNELKHEFKEARMRITGLHMAVKSRLPIPEWIEPEDALIGLQGKLEEIE